ncbi:MAG: coproporphyrinogen III oxidase, partial [Lachnospiraceae bacterium]|nr:coproporphyrinogen III oxidase [Lachnospiraceae bacterium]
VWALTKEEQMEEFMFLGLRLMEGVDLGEFQRAFGMPVEEVYGKPMTELEAQGLLVRTGERLSLTPRGIDVSNVVFAEFLI